MRLLRVKDWKEFQHFKDRRPPWIKLYNTLLDNFVFHKLPVESRALAPMLWLMASEGQPIGTIRYDIEMISYRLRMSEEQVSIAIQPLIDKGFFELDITVISERYPDDRPERKTKTETKTEEEREEGLSKDFKMLSFQERISTITKTIKWGEAQSNKSWQRFVKFHPNKTEDELVILWEEWVKREIISDGGNSITELKTELTEHEQLIQRLGDTAWRERIGKSNASLLPSRAAIKEKEEYEKINGGVWWKKLKEWEEGRGNYKKSTA